MLPTRSLALLRATLSRASSTAIPAPLPAVTLYQYKICPFCNKVKALLDFCNAPYQSVEVDPFEKKEIGFSADYRKVPIAEINGAIVTDSPDIMQELLNAGILAGASTHASSTSSHPLDVTAFTSDDAQRWAKWADDSLAVLLFPNLVRSIGEARSAFSYVRDVPHFTTKQKFLNQNVGGFAMWMARGKLKKKYGIDDERAALFAAADEWVRSGLGGGNVGSGAGMPFAGGKHPHLGDVAVFGVIRGLRGLPVHAELLDPHSDQWPSDAPPTRANELAAWYSRMEDVIGSSGEIAVLDPPLFERKKKK